MSYKIKSLLYFICFVASAVLYYALEPENNNKNNRDSAEIIELRSDNLDLDYKLAKLEKIQE
ncbi:hypothetical protein GQ41_4310 [Arenibacter algicola]|jgi:cbb3-type cytochrome oxidase subunit 3|uniref:Uncharacterized protein n=1 Tax=Arenibacter algicola TaxID=616991 RepID=A0A221USC4_9FLAO|nr:hypothetical protein [Arenibacter algicola]ASO04006.1 hypothetical protein AREALGSMS7_00517 [Arenibacter algicola]|tara:strand:- start:189 stop:374 length:186 start_codon:yes stop_codon:yes gene_type:complete